MPGHDLDQTSEHGLFPPQLFLNARMLYLCWVPADPEATAGLLPQGLEPAENRAIFMNQYVIDKDEHCSHLSAFSLTYLGVDVRGHDVDGGTPGRWWTHYFHSDDRMQAYVRERGVPAEAPGRTTVERNQDGDTLVATTSIHGKPVIRSTVRAGTDIAGTARGHLHYITRVDHDGGALVGGRYPYVGDTVTPFEVVSIEFLDPGHSTYTLRPRDPLEITFGFYSPGMSFCYPGGEKPL